MSAEFRTFYLDSLLRISFLSVIGFGFLYLSQDHKKSKDDPLSSAEVSISATAEAVNKAGKTTSFESSDNFSQDFYGQVHSAVIELYKIADYADALSGSGCTAFQFDPQNMLKMLQLKLLETGLGHRD